MIEINETKKGDCLYALLSVQSSPVFVEVVKVLEKENAIEVFTTNWGSRVVVAQNAYWEEKEAKKNKIVRIEHNYKQWIKEMLTNEEEETDNRINTVHNGQSKVSEDQGKDDRDESIPKRTKRKQKVVRKSTTKQRKPRRNRKSRSSKK